MVHVLLDAWIWGRAVARPVTVLLLLGLWPFAFPTLGWGASEGVVSATTLFEL